MQDENFKISDTAALTGFIRTDSDFRSPSTYKEPASISTSTRKALYTTQFHEQVVTDAENNIEREGPLPADQTRVDSSRDFSGQGGDTPLPLPSSASRKVRDSVYEGAVTHIQETLQAHGESLSKQVNEQLSRHIEQEKERHEQETAKLIEELKAESEF